MPSNFEESDYSRVLNLVSTVKIVEFDLEDLYICGPLFVACRVRREMVKGNDGELY